MTFIPPTYSRSSAASGRSTAACSAGPRLACSSFVVLLILLVLAFGSIADVQSFAESHSDGDSRFTQFDGRLLTLLILQFTFFAELPQEQIAQILEHARLGVAFLFQMALFLTVFFYLSGTLYDDRKDHSVLFWKSMPISDTETVVAKLLMVMFIAPAIAVVAMFIGQLLFFVIATFLAWSGGVSAWETLWQPSGLLSGVVLLVVGYILNAFWMLPLFTWVLMISAYANRAPLMWTILVPVLVYILEVIVFGRAYIGAFFRDHVGFRVLPHINPETEQSDPRPLDSADGLFQFVISGELWLGVLVGAVFLVAAVYLRRLNNEI